MGSFFTDILSFQHETAVFDVNPHQLRFVYNTYRFTTLEEIKDFEPELVINAVTVKYTLDAFHKVLPVLPKDCIISDIASVKTGLKKFYEESGFRYVSSHPMFGPTFASLSNLSSENAIIISEGDHLGKIFFKDLYQTLRLNIFEYTRNSSLLAFYSVRIDFCICCRNETSGSSGNYVQKAHGNCQRPIKRRRLPASGNSIQPTHSGAGSQYPHGVEESSRNYREQRCGRNEKVSD